MSTLFIVNCFVCIVGGLYRGPVSQHSMTSLADKLRFGVSQNAKHALGSKALQLVPITGGRIRSTSISNSS
jgi:hypothetical protein